MRDFHYFPMESVNYDGEFDGETFICTGLFYNSKNNFIAVYRCFLGCSYEYILVDFSNPFGSKPYLYIFDIIDDDDFYFSLLDKDNCWGDKDFECYDRKSNKKL